MKQFEKNWKRERYLDGELLSSVQKDEEEINSWTDTDKWESRGID